jgi:hypothetical protein
MSESRNFYRYYEKWALHFKRTIAEYWRVYIRVPLGGGRREPVPCWNI